MTNAPTGGGKIRLIKSLRIADARARLRHVFIRDQVLVCSIGVHKRELNTLQRVRVNLDMAVLEGDRPLNDDLKNVVCYEKIAAGVRTVADRGHINLVETLAERIAAACLGDSRVRSVLVRVEKLDVFDDVDSVGVEIERFAPDL
jgi:dihydroneopterin aldolase